MLPWSSLKVLPCCKPLLITSKRSSNFFFISNPSEAGSSCANVRAAKSRVLYSGLLAHLPIRRKNSSLWKIIKINNQNLLHENSSVILRTFHADSLALLRDWFGYNLDKINKISSKQGLARVSGVIVYSSNVTRRNGNSLGYLSKNILPYILFCDDKLM